jgi:hypothetical protein
MTKEQLESLVLFARLIGIPVALAPVEVAVLLLPDTEQARSVVETLKNQGVT